MLVTPEGGVGERFDLAVIAEGGVFAEQSRKAVTHDYKQTAWVGTVTLQGATPGLAMERFTRDGPLALLPLPALPGADPKTSRAALVWCVDSADDPVAPLTDAQRLAVLATRLPDAVGTPVGISALKSFALGLNAEASLVDGRVVRIGNAAQTLHPVAGQGPEPRAARRVPAGRSGWQTTLQATRCGRHASLCAGWRSRARPTAGASSAPPTSSHAASPGTRRAWRPHAAWASRRCRRSHRPSACSRAR